MNDGLPESLVQLIEGKNFAFVATLMRDGSPQVTPVWIDRDGDLVIFNTAMGRTKQRNLARDPRLAMAIVDCENPIIGAGSTTCHGANQNRGRQTHR